MDYEVGSIADLISGLHTPNRPRVQAKALTPVKKPPVDDDTPRGSPSKLGKNRKLLPLSKEFTSDQTSSQLLNSKQKPDKHVKKISETKEKRFNNFQFLSQLSDYESDENTNEKNEFVKEYYEDKNGIVRINKDKLKTNSVDHVNNEMKCIESKQAIKTQKKKRKNQENNEIMDSIISNKKRKKTKNQNEFSSEETQIQDSLDANGILENLNLKLNKKKRNLISDLNDIPLVSRKKKTISDNEAPDIFNSHVNSKKSKQNDINEQFKIDNTLNSKKSKEKKINVENQKFESGLNNKCKKVKKNEADSENESSPENDNFNENSDTTEVITDFQKAAQRRIENKIKKDSKFEENELNRTIFVGNIPVSILKGKYKKLLKSKFSPYGTVESIRIRNVPVEDLKTNPKVAFIEKKFHPDRSTVSAYIKFSDPLSVEKSLVENNTKIEENHIRVDSCSSDTKPNVDSRKTLFLGNLAFNIEEEKIRQHFEQFGSIISVRVIRDKKTQIGKGFGFVNFEKADGVELALSVPEENMQIDGKIVRVKRYNLFNPKDSTNKNQVQEKFNNTKNQRNFGKSDISAQFKNRKRDEQGNKLRKRNMLPNQFKKNKSFDKPNNINNSSGTENDAANKPHDDSYKGLVAKKKKKNKQNKGVLQKKRISKIFTQDLKPTKST